MAHDMHTLLKMMGEKGASDLHLTVGSPAQLRIDERLIPVDGRVLAPDDTKALTFSILSDDQVQKFERDLELDLALSLANSGRFRVNVFRQRSTIACSVRRIPDRIWNFEECGLPVDIAIDLCKRPKGLILLTGATGCGKSTSLASMIDWINTNRSCHIITIEDPIEFLHGNKQAIVNQREIEADTRSFAASLKHVLRQDPDVILIGEMRDLETIESALVIAETGHLVFATLHTSDCVQTINRIIDVFPAHQQQQIRTQLSFVLIGAISQQLIPHIKGTGRVLASEVLMVTPAVRSLIRESKIHQIYSVMQTSQREGMRTMNQSLYDLYKRGMISVEEAYDRTSDLDDLKRILRR